MSFPRVDELLSKASDRARVLAAHSIRLARGGTARAVPELTRAIGDVRRAYASGLRNYRAHLLTFGVVLSWVASALVVRYLVGASESAATFLFYPTVVAFAAWRGDWSAGAVAVLGSVLAVYVFDSPSRWTSTLFVAEGVAIIALVTTLTRRLRDRADTLDSANRRVGEFQSANQHARTLDVAVRSLETLTPEYAIVLLDRQGLVAEWRPSAQKLYGITPDLARGRSASMLFPDGAADSDFRALLAEAERGAVVRKTAWQRRGDGTPFEADVELALTVGVGGDGFAMVIRDRTLEHERQLTAAAAAESHRALRDEMHVAQRQLAALQLVTDPSLNAWPPSHLVAELLERLREVVQADGIALVLMRGVNAPRVFSTPDGLHPEGVFDKPFPGDPGQASARVIFVQNDEARVAEKSLLRWPAGTASLIAVPVVQAGELEGTIEVVDRRGRRSTEWEIALVQVVAARVAGLAHDHGYADSAVA